MRFLRFSCFLCGFIELLQIVSSEDGLKTMPEVIGMMGTTVSIDCDYQSSEAWYVIQWQRQIDGSEPLTIVTLPRTFNVEAVEAGTQWNEKLDPSFRQRLRAFVNYNKMGVTFNLEIYSFSCNDTGVYTCVLTGNERQKSDSKLSIKALPSKPVIHNNEIIVDQENYTVTLECEGLVGLPPAKLQWYQQYPDGQGFLMVNTQTSDQVVELGTECRPIATQRIDVMVTRAVSGSIFRCMAESPLLDTSTPLFDDVEVKIEDPEPTPKYQLKCMEGNCFTTTTQITYPNHANSAMPSIFITMVTVLMVLFIPRMRR